MCVFQYRISFATACAYSCRESANALIQSGAAASRWLDCNRHRGATDAAVEWNGLIAVHRLNAHGAGIAEVITTGWGHFTLTLATAGIQRKGWEAVVAGVVVNGTGIAAVRWAEYLLLC